MLKKFVVSNFKNFKEDIIIDFGNIGGYKFSTDCISNNHIAKMLIYGQNATGKTNLGDAIMDIKRNLISSTNGRFEKTIINANSKEEYSKFTYTFRFERNEIEYKYSKISQSKLYEEELIIDGKSIFYCNFEKNVFDLNNLELVSAGTLATDIYINIFNEENIENDSIQTLPFMKWLISNSAQKGESVILKLNDYVRRMSFLAVGTNLMKLTKNYFFESLDKEINLKDFEEFLNVMGVECQLLLKKLPDGSNELYFKYDNLIPFYENASSGTLALTNLYRRIFINKNTSMLYLDEFDAFYHFEMAEKVLKYLKFKFPNCQIILTSHNTNLISNRLMRPDCVFILSKDGRITSLSNASERELREGHNLEKMYISGEFQRYE